MACINAVITFYKNASVVERFRTHVSYKDELTSLQEFKKHVENFAGIKNKCKDLGIPSFELKLFRLVRSVGSSGDPQNYAIYTQEQWEIERPFILNNPESSQLNVHVVEKLSSTHTLSGNLRNCVESLPQNSSKPLKNRQVRQECSSSVKRKRKIEAAEDKTIKLKIRNAEEIKRNERQEKELKELNDELQKLAGSSAVDELHVKCGLCKESKTICGDRSVSGKVNHFKSNHFMKCQEKKEKLRKIASSCRKIDSVFLDMSQMREPAACDSTPQEKIQEDIINIDIDDVFDDIALSEMGRDAIEPNINYGTEISEQNFSWDGSDDEGFDIIGQEESEEDRDLIIFPCSYGTMDPLAEKINDLIQRGKMPKECFFYKFIDNAVTYGLIDWSKKNDFKWDLEVLEFFQSVKYLGGAKTTKFVRGPCHHGSGKGGVKNFTFSDANLGGPSDNALRKIQSGYTPYTGVIKDLLEAFLAIVFEGPSPSLPIISTSHIKTVTCAIAIDGTALKPGIQFDDHLKVCVGLKNPVDLTFVKDHPNMSPDELKADFVTEAVPYILTSMDMKNSMPVAVDYETKSKTGVQVKNTIVERIRTVQICRNCCHSAKTNNLILRAADLGQEYCFAHCDLCWSIKKVCQACEIQGQTSHIPALRACKKCLDRGLKCEKVAVVVVTTDCEESNKQALTQLHYDVINERAPPDLHLLVAMPDIVHVGKSLKCSWSNWILWFNGARSTLAVLYNLRRESEPELRVKLKKLLTEESVRNKDRMAVEPIILLTTPELLELLTSIKLAVYTLVPEKYRMWRSNRPGMYPHPVYVVCGAFGTLLVIDYDPMKETSKLLQVRLHSPADVEVLVENLEGAKTLAYAGGVAYCLERKKKHIHYTAMEKIVKLKISSFKKKEDVQSKLRDFGLSTDGTVATLKERLKDHLDFLRATKYKNNDDKVICDSFVDPVAICPLSQDMLLVADDGKKRFHQVSLAFDGVGIQSTVTDLCHYPASIDNVSSMCLSSANNTVLFTASGELSGIYKIDLASHDISNVLNSGQPEANRMNIACATADSEGVIYFTDTTSRQIWKKDSNGLSVHAGKGQPGTNDGSALLAEFSQPFGICCEGRTQFVTDAATGCVKMVIPLDSTVEFLRHLGNMYSNFGIHLKGKKGQDTSLENAILCLRNVTTYLRNCVIDVQQQMGRNKITNGPEGTVANKTILSCELMLSSISRLKEIQEIQRPDSVEATNLQSLLTLVVENLHATTKIKHPAPTTLDYCRDFGRVIKESLKRISRWSVKYFTHNKSYYPVPKIAMSLADIPKLKPLPVAEMNKQDIAKMREWACDHGKCVRQLTVRQQTTKFSAGTLPLSAYSVDLEDNPLSLSTADIPDEYESDSDESLSDSTELSDDESQGQNAEQVIRTRTGRQIRAIVRLDL